MQLTAFLRLISARSKARLGLPQFTRCLVPAMCPSCCCMCRWLIAVRPSSPSLMKLKPGLEIPSMAASPTSSPCSSRYPSSSFTPLFYIQYPFLSLTPLPHHYPIKISPCGHIYFLHEKNIYKTFFFFCMCFSLQQVACLQAQLMHLKAQLANNTGNLENQWQGNVSGAPSFQNFPGYMNSVSPQCSLESIDHNSDGMAMQDIQSRDEFSFQTCSRKRPPHNDLGELQELALRMMRN